MGQSPGLPRRFSHPISRSFCRPHCSPFSCPHIFPTPTPAAETGDAWVSPLGFSRAAVTFPPSLLPSSPCPQQVRLCPASRVSHLTASHGPGLSLCVSSTVSKQRKNVISCVTVHDSPYSDSSSNTSPYSVQHRAGHNATTFDTKGSLEPHCTGNPRTIIVPPLKTQASEVLVECDSLGPGNSGRSCREPLWRLVFCFLQLTVSLQEHLTSPGCGQWVVRRSSPRILLEKIPYCQPRRPERTSYLSQKPLPVMTATSFLNHISWTDGWMDGQMGGWMDGWVGSLQRLCCLSGNKPGQPSVFPTEGGIFCSQETILRNHMFWNYSIWAPLRFLTPGGSANIEESEKAAFLL